MACGMCKNDYCDRDESRKSEDFSYEMILIKNFVFNQN